jgi:hypothetical protein
MLNKVPALIIGATGAIYIKCAVLDFDTASLWREAGYIDFSHSYWRFGVVDVAFALIFIVLAIWLLQKHRTI